VEDNNKIISYNGIAKNSRECFSFVVEYSVLNGILSAEDMGNIQSQLWQLLGRQTGRFTMGDSSSVPIETAQELLASICYCIGIYLKESGIDEGAIKLKSESLSDLFAHGQRVVATKIDLGRKLLSEAKKTALDIDNISYHDTLREIEYFFKKYDYRFFAHDIPCMIDYQLCHSIPELSGIEYINEYLSRLIIENKFCRHFNSSLITSLLQGYCHDYREQLINMFEPVLTNATGLALLDKNIFLLDVNDADRVDLLNLFRLWTEEEALENLITSAEKLCSILSIEDISSREYLKSTASGLMSRIRMLKETGNFDNLFPGFHEQEEKVPVFHYYDGGTMSDKSLRNLIEEMRSCRYLSDKIAMIKQVHSIKDLIEVLNACFSYDEFTELFSSFNDTEIAVLMHFLFEKHSTAADWNPYLEWEVRIIDYVKNLDAKRQEDITHMLDGVFYL